MQSIRDYINGVLVGNALFLSYKLDILTLLIEKSYSLKEISEKLLIEYRPLWAILAVCISINVIEQTDDGKYTLSRLGKDFFDTDSKNYCHDFLIMMESNSHLLSIDTLLKAVQENKPQVFSGNEMFSELNKDEDKAKIFTKVMHNRSAHIAHEWVKKVDLCNAKTLLDIGAGSGIHVATACLYNEKLKGIIFDLPRVCSIAKTYVEQYTAKHRLSIFSGNMWVDNFPVADVHLYSDVIHDWGIDKCRDLLLKSYESLPSDGILIIHEMLINKKNNIPLPVAIVNLKMLLWTEGCQYTFEELETELKKVGFRQVEFIPTVDNWGVILARK